MSDCGPLADSWTGVYTEAEEEAASIIEEVDRALGAKQTDGKLPLDLVPWLSVMEMTRVLEFGAQKYDAWNWSKGLHYMKILAGVMRHILKFIGGQDNDDETGLSHLAHAMCGIAFILHFVKMGGGVDDRPAALAGMMEKLSTPDPKLWSNYAGVGFKDK